ncbi:MAG: HAD-IB family phosphatase, partial [Brevundimonas sp.]|uniref:HAD-IB family phosphatase n=1 Tax=Brevundimonas sp. TaxID=1871086 RepID=UPI0027338F65
MSDAPTLIFDFDSTLVGFETLEVLAELALEGAPEAGSIRAEIAALTDQAMSGALGFDEALTRRLILLPLTRDHVQALAEQAVARLAPSVARNVETLRLHADRLVIVSGGFREVIAPVARHLGVPDARVLANDLTYDDAGRVTGVDRSNPLSADGGKVTAIRALGLSGTVVMIGDGWTDAEVRLAGLVDRFHAFCEVVRRPRVVEAADAVAVSLDEVLHAEGLSGRWSYPRSRIRVLLLESVHPAAIAALEDAGYSVECETGALDEDALIDR